MFLQRSCGALKFTIVFLILAFVLLLIGALVHTKPIASKGTNTTEWQKLKALLDMESNWIENSLSLVMCILSVLGMIALFVYTAYGMASLPVGLIKGHRNVKQERLIVTNRKSETHAKVETIRNKYLNTHRNVSSRDASRIADLEESEALMERQERHLAAKDNCYQRCLVIFRPFQIVLGICLILLALLVFISLLLTNIDKAIHSNGPKQGYALPKRSLPNPVDIVLVFSQKVFPLDYILFGSLVFYLVFCSMSGLRNIGIWFFCLRMYRIRPRRTRPQALLMLCFILSFIMLAVNIIVFELTPQYSSYGSQHYQTSKNTTEVCTLDQTNEDCVLTTLSLLLTRFFYKMWIFGAVYYWGTWIFLLFILLGFVIAICKKRKSAIDGEVEEDDIVDSDDDMLPA